MTTLATFSEAGWVKNPLERIDYMLSYFFTTQKSQTHFHNGVVRSYQSMIGDATSMSQLGTDLESTLGDYFKTQFQNVQIEVTIAGADGISDNSELTITIGCTLTADGKRMSLSHAIEMLGTQVKKIYRLNETGQT